MTTDKTPAPMPAKLSSGPLQDGTAGSGATPTTDKTDAELIERLESIADCDTRWRCTIGEAAARIAELAQTVERLTLERDGMQPAGWIELQQAAAASAKDAARQVPREPTEAMMRAGDVAWGDADHNDYIAMCGFIWRAMYDAAIAQQETQARTAELERKHGKAIRPDAALAQTEEPK